MANLGNGGFDANTVPPKKELEVIPAGKYLAAIIDSQTVATKSGTGSFVEMKFQLLDGEHKGRVLFARLNLNNPNAEAVRIAREELSAICHAVGVLRPMDSVELHNIPLCLSVKLVKRKDNGEAANEISGYYPKDEASNASPAAPASGGAASAVAPWKR